MKKMRFAARVKTDDGEWIEFEAIRWIALDQHGRPERICGPNGLQYSEFELIILD